MLYLAFQTHGLWGRGSMFYVYYCACGHARHGCMWKSEDNFME